MKIKEVEKFRQGLKKLSDAELHVQMHSWKENSAMHVAAKVELDERRKKKERIRFHLIFWPSLVAALIGFAALTLNLYGK